MIYKITYINSNGDILQKKLDAEDALSAETAFYVIEGNTVDIIKVEENEL